MTGQKKVLVIFQRGGADGLSLCAPVYDPHYRNVLRPTIRVGEPAEGTALDGLALDSTFALHPAMASLHSRWVAQPGGLAFVHAVGYPDHNRSHFESQDIYLRGLAANDPGQAGWVNRYSALTSQGSADALVRLLTVGSLALPTSFTGSYPAFALDRVEDMTIPLTDPALRTVLEDAIAASRAPGCVSPALLSGSQGVFDLSDHFGVINPQAYVPGATYPASGLGADLEEVAMIMKADLGIEIFWVDDGGWDHHSNLPGVMPGVASDLADSVDAFMTDMGTLMDDVVIVVMSEFGRTAAENGSSGTDHGKGGLMMLLGGAVQGGQVHGAWPGVGPSDLDDDRFLVDANDYRDVLGDVLTGHLNLSPALLTQVFPGHTYTPVGVI